MKKYFLALVSFLLMTNLSFAATGIIDNSRNALNLYFTGSPTSVGNYYLDGATPNPDAGLELCGYGSQYIGGFYGIYVYGTYSYVPITYASSSNALALASNSAGSCYYVNPGGVTFSIYQYSTPDPDIFIAAFPGRVLIGFSGSPNPGVVSNFLMGTGQLLGSYSVLRSFNYIGPTGGTINSEVSQISFSTTGGSVVKNANDAEFGISSTRRLVSGICADSQGLSCYAATIKTSAGVDILDAGLTGSPVTDQHTYRRYAVVNGLGYSLDIGADVRVSALTKSKDTVYYSQDQEINYTIMNYGNIPVTSLFYVRTTIENSTGSTVANWTKAYNQDLAQDSGSLNDTITWNAVAHSGTYTIRVIADYGGNLNETNEANNQQTTTFELKPIAIPEIYVDGEHKNSSVVFEYPGRAYNLKLHLHDSDEEIVSNATVNFTEENGIMLFSPTQVWSADIGGGPTDAGTKTKSIVEVITDDYGNVSFTIIPSWNPLYKEEYEYTDIESFIGNYSMYLSGAQEGSELMFVVAGILTNRYPLEFENLTYTDIGITTKTHYNQGTYIKQVMDYLYSAYALFWRTVV